MSILVHREMVLIRMFNLTPNSASKLFATFFAILCLFACNIDKDTTQSKNTHVSELASEKEAYIDALFSDYSGDRPGASILIAKDGHLILCKGYGLAQVKPARKADCDTNYRLNSVSKQFTAMAVLHFIDDEALSFETTLTHIFPDFIEHGGNITIGHLLTHQSGLQAYGDISETADSQGKQIDDQDVLDHIKSLEGVYFLPGKEWHYSNTGYALLASVVENVSGVPFEAYVQDMILRPAGMSNSVHYSPEVEIHNRAYV